MRLEGIHHITAITGDAVGNVEFYTGVMGMRMVKRTVNQDDPTVYHLFYGDEHGSPGFDLTFFEYPGAESGRPGQGMVHRILWRAGSTQALDFWRERLEEAGALPRGQETVLFADPEGLEHEIVVSSAPDEPLTAQDPEIPAEFALQGFEGVRALSGSPAASERLLGEVLGFKGSGAEWEVRGERRGSTYTYDSPSSPALPRPGAGTVHHVAFAAQPDDIESWREVVQQGGMRPTSVIERFYFRSVYFREPSGVLFEIATIGPGFAVDEDEAHLGETLSLPPDFEQLRGQLDGVLTPLPYPPPWRAE